MVNKGDKWSFKNDGKATNQKFWGQTATVVDADGTDVKYLWDDVSLRNPTFPTGVRRDLSSFLSKFELVSSATTVIVAAPVSEEEVKKFLKSEDIEVHKAPSKSCSICTDDTKELKNGKCIDCRHIHALLKEHGKKFSIKEYYGFEPLQG